MKTLIRCTSMLLLCGSMVAPAVAQLVTDRPGFGFATSTVERNHVIVELGLPTATTFTGDTDITFFSTPLLVRYGVGQILELRVGTSLFDAVRAGGNGDSELGFDVVEVGGKVTAWTSADGNRALALIPSVFIPTEGGDVQAAVNAVAGLPINATTSLSLVGGFLTTDDDLVGALAAIAARPLNTTLGGYIELGAFPTSGATPVYAGAGLTLLLSDSAQLDVSLDRGLSDDAADWLWGFGAAVRL